jgi:transcriptional regulator with GAF, ATPase, and Fis domain
MKAESFDSINLFFNSQEYLRRASGVLSEALRRGIESEITYQEIHAPDPTDYDVLYGQMLLRCEDIVAASGPGADLWIATSSGTPQMQTCWLLLVLGGSVNARLIQITPPDKQQPGRPIFRVIQPNKDQFPEIRNPGRLRRELAEASSQLRVLKEERERLASESTAGLVGQSSTFRKAAKEAKQFARFDLPVLIRGETGVGKEEFAKLVHFSSTRCDKPFLPINCAAISEQIAESELFGHRRGAFTGATEHRRGLFEDGSEGTVFLDEVGELSLGLQAKLLRVLENGSFRPVGETREKETNARIIAATNRSLEVLVSEGHFREDLLFRLKGAEIYVPPLRDRADDVFLLAQHFLDRFNQKHGLAVRFDKVAFAALQRYQWPGNVRELKNAVERLAILARTPGIIRSQDVIFPQVLRKGTGLPPVLSLDTPIDLGSLLAEFEKRTIEAALDRFQGNRSGAARHLGYEGPAFRKKCRAYFGRKR